MVTARRMGIPQVNYQIDSNTGEGGAGGNNERHGEGVYGLWGTAKHCDGNVDATIE